MTSVLPTTIDRLDDEVRALRARLDGDAVTPNDAGWDEARQAWNLDVDQRPAMVVLPESADDVVEAVRFARSHGMHVAPQATGHNAGPLRLEETILLKASRMRGVEVDPVARIARVEPGALWQDVVGPAAEHGLAALSGSSPDVGVVGYSLGGGLSWLARSLGLAANSVTAVEIVTADGELRRIDAENDPDLFWAVRGGGGSFGAVTALEFRLYPITGVYAGMFVFPQERAAEVLHTWRELLPGLPDEMTTVGRILNVPPLEDIPEPLRGRALAVVEAIYIGDEAEGAALVAPLRELGPELDTFATISPKDLIHLHMDPPNPVPGRGDSVLLREDSIAESIDGVLAAAGPGTSTTLLSVEFRQLGGAVARRSPGHGALGSIDAGFAMFAVGMTPTPEIGMAVAQDLGRVRDALARYDAGREYLNFAESATDPSRFTDSESYERLRRVKAEYDPADLFRSNHPIPPAR